MLNIVTGRAKSGKTARMYLSVVERAKSRRQILIVPETSSHKTERELVERGTNRIGLNAEVFTFQSLATRIFSEVGGLCDQYLDGAGRLLTMRLAVSRASASLKTYNKAASKPEFLNSLIRFADEMKSSGIAPEDLSRASCETGGTLSKRLLDLSGIYSAYCYLTKEGALDPRDRMTRLLTSVRESRFFDGAEVWFDSFSGFTRQEFLIIGEIMKKAESATLFLTCADLRTDGGEDVFQKPRKTAAKLLRLAESLGVTASVSHLGGGEDDDELSYLERNLYAYGAGQYGGQCRAIRLMAARDPFEECERIASGIIRLTREEHLRYRDIAVVSRSFDMYAPILEIVFERYGIPAFFSRKTDILSKPVVSLLLSAVDAVRSDFKPEPLLQYLKTGLSGVKTDDADLLENYILTWNIEGKLWTKDDPWTLHPDGYAPVTEASSQRLCGLNRIRDEVRAPLVSLKEALSEARAGGEYAKVLYEFMEDIGLFDSIQKASDRFLQKGERALAAEYNQLFEILCDALGQFFSVLGREPLELSEFCELFSLLLSGYDVGTIPAVLDTVTLGDVQVALGQHFQAVFIPGAADGMLPPPPKQDGLLSDDDRDELILLGLDLDLDPESRAYEEDYHIYGMFSCALSRLFVSYPLYAKGEAKLRPAHAASRLLKLFSDLSPEFSPREGALYRLDSVVPAFDLALSASSGTDDPAALSARRYFEGHPEFLERIWLADHAAAQKRGPVSGKERIRGLYGDELRMTASRAEKFESCRFSFFMQYGLSLKVQKSASFDAPAIGTFIHYILENGIKALNGAPGGVKAASKEDVKEVCRLYTGRYVDEVLSGLEGKSKRFVHLFERLGKSAAAILQNVVDELLSSLFAPLDFELSFSDTGDLPPVKTAFSDGVLSLNGKVDRVDGYEKDGKLYLRVVDYKTGRKSFSLSDVFNGLDMQLLLYLFTMEERGLRRYGERLREKIESILPAGVLYVPAYEKRLRSSRPLTREELERLTSRELRRSGLILGELPVIEAMEPGISGDGRFLPVKLNLDKTISAMSSVASSEQFVKLKDHVRGTLREMGELIMAGNLDANPYRRGPEESACDFCEFKRACLFDESGPNDKMRSFRHLKPDEVFRMLSGRDGGDGR